MILRVPTPEPSSTAEAAAAAAGTEATTILVAVAIAVLGLVGVFGGALIAARSALRTRLIDMNRVEAEALAGFQIRTIAAVNAQNIVFARIMEYHNAVTVPAITKLKPGDSISVVLDPALHARVVGATESWRGVLAEAHYYGDTMSLAAMEEYDLKRAAFLDAANTGKFPEADALLESLTDFEGRQLYRAFQVAKVHSQWSLASMLSRLSLRNYVTEWRERLEDQIQLGKDHIIAAAIADKGGPEVSAESTEQIASE